MPNFDGTGSLERGQFEFIFNNNSLFPLDVDFDDMPNISSFGAGIGIGVHPQVDIKFTYNREYEFNTGENIDFDENLNLLQLNVQISNKKQWFAFTLPFGMIFNRNFDNTFYAVPHFMFSPVRTNNFELIISPFGEVLYIPSSVYFFAGTQIGLGFSSNFSVWSIRPVSSVFIGLENPEDILLSIGISVSFTIGGNKSE